MKWKHYLSVNASNKLCLAFFHPTTCHLAQHKSHGANIQITMDFTHQLYSNTVPRKKNTINPTSN